MLVLVKVALCPKRRELFPKQIEAVLTRTKSRYHLPDHPVKFLPSLVLWDEGGHRQKEGEENEYNQKVRHRQAGDPQKGRANPL